MRYLDHKLENFVQESKKTKLVFKEETEALRRALEGKMEALVLLEKSNRKLNEANQGLKDQKRLDSKRAKLKHQAD